MDNAGMESLSPPAFMATPAACRVFVTSRIVRSTDVTPAARLRFDALARYLQETAEDDLADAGWNEPLGWLLRRVAIAVRGYPARGDRVRCGPSARRRGPGGPSARPRWPGRLAT